MTIRSMLQAMMQAAAVSSAGAYIVTVTSNVMPTPSASPTPNVPTPGSPVVGDLIYFVVGFTGRGPMTWPTGYTQIEYVTSASGDSLNIAVHVCDGTESGTITATGTGSGDWGALGMLVHADGATLSTESHASAEADSGGATVHFADYPWALAGPSSTTTAGDDRLVLWVASVSSHGNTGSVATLNSPSGFTENGRIEDGACEFIACSSKTILTAATATYSGSVTLTGEDVLTAYVAAIVIAGGGPAPMGFTGTLPNANISTAYSHTLNITGNFVSPITADVSVGSLPSWMTATVNESLRIVTYAGTTPGSGATFTFTPRITDSTGTPQVATDPQSVVISSFTGIIQTKPLKTMGGGPAATYTITPTAPFTSGNGVVLLSNNYGDGGSNLGFIASVTCNGVAMTKHVGTNDGTFEGSIWSGYAGGGSAGIVVTLGGSSNLYFESFAIERDDFVASSPLDTTNTATGTSTAPSVSLTAATAHEFVCSVMLGENGATDTITVPSSPWIQAYVDSDGSSEVPCAAAYNTVTSTGSVTAAFTYAASHAWKAIIAAFKLQ